MKLQHKTTLNIIEGTQVFLDANSNAYILYVATAPTFEENKASKIKENASVAQSKVDLAFDRTPNFEALTFDMQLRDVVAYDSDSVSYDNGTETKPLEILKKILTTGETIAQLVGKVKVNSNGVFSIQQLMRENYALIELATTQSDLDAIVL